MKTGVQQACSLERVRPLPIGSRTTTSRASSTIRTRPSRTSGSYRHSVGCGTRFQASKRHGHCGCLDYFVTDARVTQHPATFGDDHGPVGRKADIRIMKACAVGMPATRGLGHVEIVDSPHVAHGVARFAYHGHGLRAATIISLRPTHHEAPLLVQDGLSANLPLVEHDRRTVEGRCCLSGPVIRRRPVVEVTDGRASRSPPGMPVGQSTEAAAWSGPRRAFERRALSARSDSGPDHRTLTRRSR